MNLERVKYLIWALSRSLSSSTDCPACKSPTRFIRRKYVFTSLRECPNCFLRFRFPKNDDESTKQFYIDETYSQGFTTDLPSETELEHLLKANFADTEKDFTDRIAVLRAAGLKPGARILDFGSSWGYGSWQFRQAGFDVYSYEIGGARKQFANQKLGCVMVDDLRTLDGSMDGFFSAHVIEHLSNPTLMFQEARRTLKPSGVFICFCPNGDSKREQVDIRAYDMNWGQVHPMMITPNFMKHAADLHGFENCIVFSDPTPEQVRVGRDGPLDGVELLAVAW